MIEKTFSLYKLIVLHMLERVNFPMTNAQITDIMLGREYTTYFQLQEVLSEMTESGLLEKETHGHTTHYRATDEGKETLSLFGSAISDEIRADIDNYLSEHALEMRSESSTTADITPKGDGNYEVRCRIREGDSTLIELCLDAPTEISAHILAENWKKRSQKVYASLMHQLTE